jgi:hypothetical protein
MNTLNFALILLQPQSESYVIDVDEFNHYRYLRQKYKQLYRFGLLWYADWIVLWPRSIGEMERMILMLF